MAVATLVGSFEMANYQCDKIGVFQVSLKS